MQRYNPQIHHRRSIRLKNYDYAQAGLYFITLCCQHRAMLFGDVVNGSMVLNAAGQIADTCWLEIPQHFPNVVLHDYVIMPNHVHGILELTHQPNPPALPAGSPIGIEGVNAPSTNDKLDRPVGAENNSPDNSVEPVAANKYSSDNPGKPVGANENSPDNNNSPDNSGTRIGANGNSPLRSPSKTVGSIVRGYKIGVTKWMRQNTPVYAVWQRNYYENIIRDWAAYERIAQYIRNNPAKWNDDRFHEK